MARHRKKMPAWLLGLLVAVAVFAVILILANALGFGDDPVLESVAFSG
ncbi:MAG: hypothetical protein WAL25_04200 [Acidimicrobiia bacterium]